MLSIVNLVLVAVARDDGDLQDVLLTMNAIFSGIFLIDFLYRLSTAPSRSGYFFRHFGWADLLASVPLAAAQVPAHLPPRPRRPAHARGRRPHGRCGR